jgi:hypothetical protein
MVRKEDSCTADVHPEMVDEYKKGGFEVVAAKSPKPAKKVTRNG